MDGSGFDAFVRQLTGSRRAALGAVAAALGAAIASPLASLGGAAKPRRHDKSAGNKHRSDDKNRPAAERRRKRPPRSCKVTTTGGQIISTYTANLKKQKLSLVVRTASPKDPSKDEVSTTTVKAGPALL
ncbi:MAG: hypothetical protein IT337_13865, partial [Thermomicrobiales bacterium]|nr:hypothetical protein [Thermomicrobiales bacterium]